MPNATLGNSPAKSPIYVYADNAATTPLSPAALEAMLPYLSATGTFGNPGGIHRVARAAASALADARAHMAACLGAARSEEIYFTSGGSESDNWVLRGAVQRFRDAHAPNVAPRIITSAVEHHAVLHTCRALAHEGVQVTYLPVDAQCHVKPSDLAAALTHDADRVALVSIMLANNEVGTVEPVAELAALAHEHGAPFHTDAVQAVGHIPVNVHELGVDALSLSAHKFCGPRGMGALYLREGFSIPPLIEGGAQERGVRAGTENVAGAVGMAAALEETCTGLKKSVPRLAAYRDELIAHVLASTEGVALTGDPGPSTVHRLPSITSFTCENVDGELLMVLLDRAGVAAATGSACSTGSVEPSHVLTAMGIESVRAKGALRLSLAHDITRQELDLLKERVPATITRARILSGTN